MSAGPVQPTPVRIPTPPDFPVTWTTPGDEQLFWNQDRTHTPDPLPPLDGTLFETIYGNIDKAGVEYAMPVSIKGKCFNSYMYVAVAPLAPPDQMGEAFARTKQQLDPAMGQLESSWENDWLPEIKSHLAWWDAFDLRNASVPELMAHVRETWRRTDRLFYLHFRIVLPGYMAISQYDDLYRDLFSGESAFDSLKLLEGFDNKTVESGRGLWALSRKALAQPEVAAVLQGHEPAEIMDALGQTESGRAFREEIRAYLNTYGQRGATWGVRFPSWIEEPTPALKNLKDYASQPELDFDTKQAALQAERDRAVADATERLKGYPIAVRERFAFMLKAAQAGYVLSEDHGFWIDFCGMYRVRQVLLELGRRLADAGVLATRDDVFFLTLDEVLHADDLFARGQSADARIAERKQDIERLRRLNAPPVLGTDYGPPPDNMITRFLMKFFGGPPPASEAPGEVRGFAGSPGKVRGRARLVRSLDDAGRLQKGEILLTATTAPPWTPLFATAGGIVTDAGGVLSHCAVVAREYRIPAVVGTGGGTAIIPDGQLIEVDGDTGTVRLLGD